MVVGDRAETDQVVQGDFTDSGREAFLLKWIIPVKLADWSEQLGLFDRRKLTAGDAQRLGERATVPGYTALPR